MKTSDFDYPLPKYLIAQEPLKQRDTSRLFCLSRDSGRITHRFFSDLPNIVKAGDRLIFNNTKVLPARLYCVKETGAKVEILFTHEIDSRTCKAMVKPARRLKQGIVVSLVGNLKIKLNVDSVLEDGSRVLSIKDGPIDSIKDILHKYGEMPLPPYIRRHSRDDDRITYQTVYAKKEGAVAAPTAGLHFTDKLMQKLTDIGIDSSFITLHVGIGTFRPVKEENPLGHTMHTEKYELSRKAVEDIAKTKRKGGRIIAVGTTVVRVLEHCSASNGSLQEDLGLTRLMILPGYRFKVVDGLITNFHLPRSTLLMLVCAFAGRENVLAAYQEAIVKKYRFYSYGDAMMII